MKIHRLGYINKFEKVMGHMVQQAKNLLAQGHINRAEVHLSGILLATPKNAQALYMMSQTQQKLNRPFKQVHYLEKLLKLEKNNPQLMGEAGEAYLNALMPGKAIIYLKKAAEKIENPHVNIVLAHAYHKNGQLKQALALLIDALEKYPSEKNLYFTLNQIYLSESMGEAAKNLMQSMLKQGFEKDVECLKNLAHVYKDTGNAKEACDLYQKILTLNPAYGQAYRLWARLYKGSAPCAVDVKALNAVESDTLKTADKVEFLFGLFERQHKQKQYGQAWSYLDQANCLKYTGFKYDSQGDLTYRRKLLSVYKESFAELSKMKGDDRTQPIFIFGFPRSGTTLVEQIVSNHSKVATAGERQEFDSITIQYLNEKFKTVDVDDIKKLKSSDFKTIGKKYSRALDYVRGSHQHLIDKMPENYLLLPLMMAAFPKGKFIHCKRQATETIFSNYRANFANGNEYSFDLKALKDVHAIYETMMDFFADVYGKRLLTLDYETLVQNQVGETERLLGYCDLEMEQSCLEFHKNKTVITTASSSQASEPIYQSSLKGATPYVDFM